MSNQNRTPAGVPTGGQFAASAKGEATGVDLSSYHPPSLRGPQSTGPDGRPLPLRALVKEAASHGAAKGDADADRVLAAGSRMAAKVGSLFRRGNR